jgi:four helix bundle protein
MFNFEKLDVWKRGIDMANLVYEVTRKFPDAERFGLTSQMRRAAVSVPSNIAEGSSRSSRSDNARFVEIATGSVFELVTQAFIARHQGFLSEEDFQQLYTDAGDQSRMFSGLRAYLLQTRDNS